MFLKRELVLKLKLIQIQVSVPFILLHPIIVLVSNCALLLQAINSGDVPEIPQLVQLAESEKLICVVIVAHKEIVLGKVDHLQEVVLEDHHYCQYVNRYYQYQDLAIVSHIHAAQAKWSRVNYNVLILSALKLIQRLSFRLFECVTSFMLVELAA